MEQKQILQAIVSIHNTAAEISVRGDDAMRMSEVLKMCRTLAFQLQEGGDEEVDNRGNGSE